MATSLRDEAPALTAAQRESLDTIVDEASGSSRILTNLLAITQGRERRRRSRREWVPLEELVGPALAPARDRARRPRPSRSTSPPTVARATSIRSSSSSCWSTCSTTPPSTRRPARRSRSARAARPTRVVIEIADRGPGLPPGPARPGVREVLPRPRRRARAGAGLGLAVCRGIAHRATAARSTRCRATAAAPRSASAPRRRRARRDARSSPDR